jgi:exosortase/archaeosortase family protein
VTAASLPARTRSARHRKPRSRPLAPARLAACLGLCTLALLSFGEMDRIRMAESWLSGLVLTVGTGVPAGSWPEDATVWFAPFPPGQVGLVVTPECTVALLIIPFLLVTAAAVWMRAPLRRPLAALAAAIVLIAAFNQLRLLTVAWFILAMGSASGFYWGHTLVGSLITVVSLASSLAVYGMILLRRGSAAPER